MRLDLRDQLFELGEPEWKGYVAPEVPQPAEE